jgi:hypothetical protein
LLGATLGRTAEGIEGTLALSQIPVDDHTSPKWLAALTAWPRLFTVELAGYRSQRGSKYRLNPDATEDDWRFFFLVLLSVYPKGVGHKSTKEIRAEMGHLLQAHEKRLHFLTHEQENVHFHTSPCGRKLCGAALLTPVTP